MRKSRRAEAAASAGSRCGVEPVPSSSPRSPLRPGSVVLARLLPTQPSAAAEPSPDRWRQAPPPPTPNHEQELPGARRARVGAETQPGPEENGEGGGGARAGRMRGGRGAPAAGSDLFQPAAPGPGCRSRPAPPRPLSARARLPPRRLFPWPPPVGCPGGGEEGPAGLSPPGRKGRRGLGRLRPSRARCPGPYRPAGRPGVPPLSARPPTTLLARRALPFRSCPAGADPGRRGEAPAASRPVESLRVVPAVPPAAALLPAASGGGGRCPSRPWGAGAAAGGTSPLRNATFRLVPLEHCRNPSLRVCVVPEFVRWAM